MYSTVAKYFTYSCRPICTISRGNFSRNIFYSSLLWRWWCSERLGGHSEDAWTRFARQGFQSNETQVWIDHLEHWYLLIFLSLPPPSSSYQGCTLQRYMEKHNVKSDTSAFQLVRYTRGSLLSPFPLHCFIHLAIICYACLLYVSKVYKCTEGIMYCCTLCGEVFPT